MIFAGKAGSLPKRGLPEKCSTQVDSNLANIRLNCKGLLATNTLAYYEQLYIMTIKSYIALTQNVKLKFFFFVTDDEAK